MVYLKYLFQKVLSKSQVQRLSLSLTSWTFSSAWIHVLLLTSFFCSSSFSWPAYLEDSQGSRRSSKWKCRNLLVPVRRCRGPELLDCQLLTTLDIHLQIFFSL